MKSVRTAAALAVSALALAIPAGAAAGTTTTADRTSPTAAGTQPWHYRHLAGTWRFPTSFQAVPPTRVGVSYRTWRFVEEYDQVCYRVFVERDVVFRATNGAKLLQLIVKRPDSDPSVVRLGGVNETVIAGNAYRYFLIEDGSKSELCPPDRIDYEWAKVYTDRQRRLG